MSNSRNPRKSSEARTSSSRNANSNDRSKISIATPATASSAPCPTLETAQRRRSNTKASSIRLSGFSCEDIPQDVLASHDYIKVEAFADQGKGLQGVSASVFGEVLAASTGNAEGVVLDVKGYGDINANEVVQFRRGSGT